MSLALSRVQRPELAARTLLSELCRLLPADGAALFLLDAGTAYVAGPGKAPDREPAFDPAAHPALRRVLAERRALLIPDTAREPNWVPCPGTDDARSLMAVPLLSAGELAGVCGIGKLEPGFFGPAHLEAAEALAALGAAALLNARDHGRLREHVERLEKLVGERDLAAQQARASLSLLEATLESTADGILVVNLNGKILSFNERFREMWRIPREVLAEHDDEQALAFVLSQLKEPDAFLGKVHDLYARTDAESFDVLEFLDGRVFERLSRPQYVLGRPTGRVWSFRDVTERKHADSVQRATYRLSEAARKAGSVDEFFRLAHEVVSELMPARNFYIALLDRASGLLTFPYFVDEIDPPPASRPPGRGLTEYVLRTAEPLLASPEVFEDLVRRGEVELIGARSVDWLGAPLKVAGEAIGAVVVQSYTEGIRFRSADTDLLNFVSGQLAVALQRKMAEEALKASERRYRLLFERNLAGVYRTTPDGRVLEGNQAFARTLGYGSREEVVGLGTAELFEDPEGRGVDLERLRSQRFVVNHETRMRRRDGRPIWVLLSESLIEAEGSAGYAVEGSLIDITERKLAEEQSRHQASHDTLTGLPNRLLFNDRLALAIRRSRRRQQRLGILFLDLDDFKHVNDTLGHSAGDETLVHVAARLRAVLREEDTVARLGGDEFILLLTGVEDETAVGVAARKILGIFEAPFVVRSRELFLSASVGIALYPDDGQEAEPLLANVDTAMYRAKKIGRNTYQFFTAEMQRHAQERALLESGLRRALPRGEFVLGFQPVLELSTRRTTGLEALVRWKHPQRGLLSPREFVGLAEDVGVIVPLGAWVLRRACQRAREWAVLGRTDLRMSVNLSGRQLQHPDLTRTVREILRETGLPAGTLDLEITESVAMQSLPRTGQVLTELGGLGIRIFIDDFGTGHSSLNYLKHFPIHGLKIDRSFIAGLNRDQKDRAIVSAVVSIAHSLGLIVVAEGVEKEEQATLLLELGCDQVQGFLFGPPLAEEEIEKLLRRERPGQSPR